MAWMKIDEKGVETHSAPPNEKQGAMLLSESERTKFATYLEQDAASDEAMVEQMLRIKTPGNIVMEFKMQAAASRMVVRKLRATESATIEAESMTSI